MNPGLPSDDPTIEYYDSDYPSADHGPYPENLDDVTLIQGVAEDVRRYLELAKDVEGHILEVGCGTGRVAIPLARAGHQVTASDISEGMLGRFRMKLAAEPADLNSRINIIQADATRLDLARKDFELAILPFNTLPCIPDFADQCLALQAISRHMKQDGGLILDLISPFRLALKGDAVPKPFFTRRNVWSGRHYTRFALQGPMDEHQRQHLYGWYDEVDEAGIVKRTPYEVTWRPLYRFEIEMMLKEAGFSIAKLEGDHDGNPFTADSARMFIHATKR